MGGLPFEMCKRPYEKKWASVPEQVALLIDRGFPESDRAALEHVLGRMNYYAFTGYVHRYRSSENRDRYVEGTCLREVMKDMEFDVCLRSWYLEMLAPVELYVRFRLAHEIGSSGDPFAHYNPGIFEDVGQITEWHASIERSAVKQKGREFVSHFRKKYQAFPRLPVWMAVECMTLDNLRGLFGRLRPEIRAAVFPTELFPDGGAAWLTFHVNTRNAAAHLNRLWDVKRQAPEAPMAQDPTDPVIGQRTTPWSGIQATIAVSRALSVHSHAEARGRLKVALEQFVSGPGADVRIGRLGLTSGWRGNRCWA